MTITPVVPLPDSQLVVDTQAIIIDFDVEPTVVYVDAVEVIGRLGGVRAEQSEIPLHVLLPVERGHPDAEPDVA